jgi:hypothetical protein
VCPDHRNTFIWDMHFESVTPSKVSPAVSQMILLPIVYFFYFSTREVYFGKWINYLKSRPPVFVNIGTDCKKVTDEIYKKTNLKKLYTHNILTKWVRFFLDSRHTGKRRTQCTDRICPVHFSVSSLVSQKKFRVTTMCARGSQPWTG